VIQFEIRTRVDQHCPARRDAANFGDTVVAFQRPIPGNACSAVGFNNECGFHYHGEADADFVHKRSDSYRQKTIAAYRTGFNNSIGPARSTVDSKYSTRESASCSRNVFGWTKGFR
jgi:hypothetical protein